ncbi:MAG: hypothetical protein CL910_04825 [Deltaproteobacteria bacterium]|jgi:ATP-binding protein involved in chromosome partitioning|nr:hypothetical protein [Deltaproteobacteria bacterium]
MPDDAAALASAPTKIDQTGPRELSITWADGVTQAIDARSLRLACACAHCVDEWSGEPRLDPDTVPDDVHPLRIEPVGRYALHITWSDTHDSGIYPFRHLRTLANTTPPKR